MKFGEKLKEQRNKRKVLQEDVARAVGITRQTLVNYESGTTHPQDRSIYFKLADFYGVDVNYFLTEDEEFLTEAAKNYGKKGHDQAQVLLEQAGALFAGGELSDNDQKAFLHTMQDLYLESKAIAREKFTPKKYRSEPAGSDNNGG
jgi:transcriptional regulator with XRE-family HTH domain